MDNVVSLDDKRPHLGDDAICGSCKHEWNALAPVGTKELECPECSTMKGKFILFTGPRDEFFTCDCGSEMFFVLRNNIQCIECAEYSTMEITSKQ